MKLFIRRMGQLKQTQERIKPLLPLRIYKGDRDARFNFNNYDDEILAARSDLSNYLYKNARELMEQARTKDDFRRVYDDLKYLSDIGSYPKDVPGSYERSPSKGNRLCTSAIGK